jgi:hypothetical protein
MEKVYVVPGTYLVRMAGDENHYPSLDTEVVVEAGEPITIWLNCNNGELPEVSVPEGSSITVSPDPDDPHVLQISGLACGDLLPPTTDPALLNADFLGWFTYSGKYDFNTPVTMSTTLTAGWKPSSIAFKLPNSTTSIGESAFEGLPMTSVELPPNCATIYPGAFKNCTGLKQIVIPNPKIIIYSGAFDGCSGVQVFAPASSYAKYLCTEDNGFVFIETVG